MQAAFNSVQTLVASLGQALALHSSQVITTPLTSWAQACSASVDDIAVPSMRAWMRLCVNTCTTSGIRVRLGEADPVGACSGKAHSVAHTPVSGRWMATTWLPWWAMCHVRSQRAAFRLGVL